MSSRPRKKCYDMKMNMGFMHAENPIWREALGRKMRAIKRERVNKYCSREGKQIRREKSVTP